MDIFRPPHCPCLQLSFRGQALDHPRRAILALGLERGKPRDGILWNPRAHRNTDGSHFCGDLLPLVTAGRERLQSTSSPEGAAVAKDSVYIQKFQAALSNAGFP